MTRGQKISLLVTLAAAILLVFHTFLASDGWTRRVHARRDLDALNADAATMRERVQSLRLQIDGLRQRSEVQEHVVRDELGYVRAGDVVVNVGEATSPR